MTSKVRVLPFSIKGRPCDITVNATSRARDWGRELSPFFLGPSHLPNGFVSKNVENAWQFSKCYPCHVDESGDVSREYWEWAKTGWQSDFAHRYPMGKGAVPLFSLGSDEHDRMDYVTARKRLYIPLYLQAAIITPAYVMLKNKWEDAQNAGVDLVIHDFDAYDHIALGMTLRDVVNDPKRKAGHGFALAMALTLPESELVKTL